MPSEGKKLIFVYGDMFVVPEKLIEDLLRSNNFLVAILSPAAKNIFIKIRKVVQNSSFIKVWPQSVYST